jgi:hypothetical protein
MRLVVCIGGVVLMSVVACASPDAQRSLSGDANAQFHDAPLKGCDAGDFDSPPIIRSGRRPIYPVGLMLDGKTGRAAAKFRVTETGRVVDLRTSTLQSHYFASHLAAAIRTWDISPAMRDGRPVATSCTFIMDYTLKG